MEVEVADVCVSPPDDTPRPYPKEWTCKCGQHYDEQNSHVICPLCGSTCWWDNGLPKPVAPDDTPTRLAIDNLRDLIDNGVVVECPELEGIITSAEIEYAELRAEVSRLQQENALLRRSLEMLTKQLAEK
jgi:hypothetical protein